MLFADGRITISLPSRSQACTGYNERARAAQLSEVLVIKFARLGCRQCRAL